MVQRLGKSRFFIEAGQHRLALAVLEEFMHSSDGPSARAILKVVSSSSHPVGSFVTRIWKLVKPAKFPQQPTDADQFADFCRKLKNAPAGHPIGNDIRVLMKERPLDQLARGTVIDCNGVTNKKGTYVNTYWNAVPQSPQDIAAMRQRIEAEGVPSASGPAQAAPVAQGYGPTPQQQIQGAPNPTYAPAQPAQGVPAGGFLANVPTNTGGNQGGNQGGGW